MVLKRLLLLMVALMGLGPGLPAQEKRYAVSQVVAETVLKWCSEAWVDPDKAFLWAYSLLANAETRLEAANQAVREIGATATQALRQLDSKQAQIEALERGLTQPPPEELDLERRRGEIQALLNPLRGFDDRIQGLQSQLRAAQLPASSTWMQEDYLQAQLEGVRRERQTFISANPGLASLQDELKRVDAAIEGSKQRRLGADASTQIMQLRRDIEQARVSAAQADAALRDARALARSMKAQRLLASLVASAVRKCAVDAQKDGAGELSGTYGGTCTDGQAAAGTFSLSIAPGGAVTGSISSPPTGITGQWDPATGVVGGATGLGQSNWSGKIARAANGSFSGGGSAKYSPSPGQDCNVKWEVR